MHHLHLSARARPVPLLARPRTRVAHIMVPWAFHDASMMPALVSNSTAASSMRQFGFSKQHESWARRGPVSRAVERAAQSRERHHGDKVRRWPRRWLVAMPSSFLPRRAGFQLRWRRRRPGKCRGKWPVEPLRACRQPPGGCKHPCPNPNLTSPALAVSSATGDRDLQPSPTLREHPAHASSSPGARAPIHTPLPMYSRAHYT